MLQVGKKQHPWLPLTAGDATKLPFKDDTFDAVTISFGLRNVQDTDAALREMYRVTRPGGRVVICEFSHPTWAPFRTVYTEYLMRALPPVARAVSSNPDAYVYLAESIRAWPDQPALAERLQQGRLVEGGLAQPHRRRRGPAPGLQAGLTTLHAVPGAAGAGRVPVRGRLSGASTVDRLGRVSRAVQFALAARPRAASAHAARARPRLRRPPPRRSRTTR